MEFPLLVNKEQKSLTIAPSPPARVTRPASTDGNTASGGSQSTTTNGSSMSTGVRSGPVWPHGRAKPGFPSTGRPIWSKSPAPTTGGRGGGADRTINPGR